MTSNARLVDLEVGSVILAPGFKTFDPSGISAYGYGKYPNVYTSLEFERILSPGGPFQRPCNAAFRRQGAQKDRLDPLRRHAERPGRRTPVLLQLLLHGLPEAGDHRPGAHRA